MEDRLPGRLLMKHYLGISLVLLTVAAICFFFLHACTSAADSTIDRVASAFSEVLHVQPQVTLNQRVVLTQTAPIAELAVVTKEELVSIALNEHLEVLAVEIPLTEKKITAEATYRIKAGFDLREPFSVDVDPTTHLLRASMPHAKILSVEQVGDIAYHGDDAWLNRISDTDRTEIFGDLNSAAHDTAEKSSLKSDAENQVSQRLNEILAHNGQSVSIQWAETPQKVLPTP
jgi:hypothetical protein